MKPIALAPPMIPATAPCSWGATDSDAPDVNPGRAMPKPRPDKASATTSGPNCPDRRKIRLHARAAPRPQLVIARAETCTRWMRTSCANSAAIDDDICPIMLNCAAASGFTCNTSMKKKPIVWIGTVLAVDKPIAKITKGRMRRSYHFEIRMNVLAFLGRRAFRQQEPDRGGAGQCQCGDEIEWRQQSDDGKEARDRRSHRRAQAERRADGCDALQPFGGRRSVGDVGLARRLRARAEQTIDRTRRDHQRKDSNGGNPVLQPAQHHSSEQREGDGECQQTQKHHGLSAPVIALASPKGRCDNPHRRRHGENARRLYGG